MTTTGQSTGTPETDGQRPHFFKRLHAWLHRHPITGAATKIVVTIIGTLVLVAGLIMMVTPGPGIVGILVGLGILATEWEWAQRLVDTMKDKALAAAERAKEMDPAVRRRRIIVGFLVVVAVGGAVAGLIAVYDWPGFAIDGWDWVQSLHGAVPELPGM
jgi:uncharacterized protein (TIGR02611 family)